jgi:hypothetical protein
MRALREYDSVRVVRLLTPHRHYDGTDDVRRAPAVGDIAIIVHEYDPDDPRAPVAVEKVDPDGNTIWLADFERDELELVETSA